MTRFGMLGRLFPALLPRRPLQPSCHALAGPHQQEEGCGLARKDPFAGGNRTTIGPRAILGPGPGWTPPKRASSITAHCRAQPDSSPLPRPNGRSSTTSGDGRMAITALFVRIVR